MLYSSVHAGKKFKQQFFDLSVLSYTDAITTTGGSYQQPVCNSNFAIFSTM